MNEGAERERTTSVYFLLEELFASPLPLSLLFFTLNSFVTHPPSSIRINVFIFTPLHGKLEQTVQIVIEDLQRNTLNIFKFKDIVHCVFSC